jgi:hypothetical protein
MGVMTFDGQQRSKLVHCNQVKRSKQMRVRTSQLNQNKFLPELVAVFILLSASSAHDVHRQQPQEETAPECPWLLHDVVEAAVALAGAILDGAPEEETSQLLVDYETALETYKVGCAGGDFGPSERRKKNETTAMIDRTSRFADEIKKNRRAPGIREKAGQLHAELKGYLQAHPVKPRVTEGALVKRNKLSLKEGYEFVRVSENKVSIRRMRSNGITGTFFCSCGDDPGGGCQIVTSGQTSTCIKSTCEHQCSWTVIVGIWKKG